MGPFVLPLGLSAAAFFFATRQKKSRTQALVPSAALLPAGGAPPTVPAGVPAAPGGGLTPDAVQAATASVAGKMTVKRYFKEPLRTSMLQLMAVQTLEPVPTPAARQGAAVYRVRAGVGPVMALQAAQLAAGRGLIVAGTLELASPVARDRFIAVLPRAMAARVSPSSRWAVLLDQQAQRPAGPPSAPAPGAVPGVVPPIPGVLPGAAPGAIPGVPPGSTPVAWPVPQWPGMPGVIPAAWPPSQAGPVPPGVPPGVPPIPPGAPPVPPGAPPAGMVPLDGNMPPELRAEIEASLKNAKSSPAALDMLASQLEGRYPQSAEALRRRATELRDLQRIASHKRGGTPFRIRLGDIPSKLAEHYVGDASRWREIIGANEHLSMRTVTKGGSTQLEPWRGEILLPLAWEAWSKPLPAVATATAQSPIEKAAEKVLNHPYLPGIPDA